MDEGCWHGQSCYSESRRRNHPPSFLLNLTSALGSSTMSVWTILAYKHKQKTQEESLRCSKERRRKLIFLEIRQNFLGPLVSDRCPFIWRKYLCWHKVEDSMFFFFIWIPHTLPPHPTSIISSIPVLTLPLCTVDQECVPSASPNYCMSFLINCPTS